MHLSSRKPSAGLKHPSRQSNAVQSVTTAAITMCSLGLLFYVYEYYLRVAPSVMRVDLKEAFSLNEAAFGHLAALYYYAYVPMQIPVGVMMDRFGPRRILTLACLVCVFGTYLGAILILPLAQLGRFLVGFGSAFGYVGVLKLSNIWLPQKYFAFMAGFCSTLGMIGGIGGNIIMTALVGSIGWQAALYYSALFGVFLTVLLWAVLRDKEITHTQGSEEQQPLVLDAVLQSKFKGLKEIAVSRQMWITGLIGCFTFLPITGFAEVWSGSYLQAVGLSRSESAVGTSMLFLGFAVGAPLWGVVSDFIRSRRIPLIIGSFLSAAMMALVVFAPSSSLVWMYSLLFLTTFFAGAEILIFAVSNDMSRPSVTGTAVAFTNMVVMIGGVLLPQIIGKSLDNVVQVVDNMPALTVQNYAMALTILPIALVLAGILSYFLKETYPKVLKTHAVR